MTSQLPISFALRSSAVSGRASELDAESSLSFCSREYLPLCRSFGAINLAAIWWSFSLDIAQQFSCDCRVVFAAL